MNNNNWLKELREQQQLTQKELAKKTGITISTIQNIEQNKRKGSEETLTILNEYFNNNNLNYKLSFDCEELIEEIKQDILEFGENEIFYAMFEIIENKLFLTNYDFISKEESLTEQEKTNYNLIVELKAKDILKLLKIQNKII